MRARLFALLIVTAMIASTLLPAVAAENGAGEPEGRQLQAEAPDCPDWEGVDAWFAAKQTEIVAEIGKESEPRDLVLGIIAAGEGEVSTDGPHPLFVVALVAYKAAQEAALIIEANHERYLECENEAHWELLRLVDDKIDELTDITETDDTENNRIEIENALYPCTPLVGFYLPIANGGQLENVQGVVQEAISGSQDAGFNVVDAQSAYDNAVDVMSQGAYRDAFIAFCSAYSELVASSGGGNIAEIPETTGSGYVYLCVNGYTGYVRQSSNPPANPPALDPSTLCTRNERPMEVLGWHFAR
ncbi:MAG: hypothetical protein R3A46_09890 [Thermomicrobiales bacterium]